MLAFLITMMFQFGPKCETVDVWYTQDNLMYLDNGQIEEFYDMTDTEKYATKVLYVDGKYFCCK